MHSCPPHNSCREAKILPRTTQIAGVVNQSYPILFIERTFYIVWVRTKTTQLYKISAVLHLTVAWESWQLSTAKLQSDFKNKPVKIIQWLFFQSYFRLRQLGTGSYSNRWYSDKRYSALHYLGPFTRVADLPGRRSLRSVGTNHLVVPPVKLSTVGSRAFPVVSPQIWNDLPEDVASAESLSTFRQRLKTHLFTKSFPNCFLDIH